MRLVEWMYSALAAAVSSSCRSFHLVALLAARIAALLMTVSSCARTTDGDASSTASRFLRSLMCAGKGKLENCTLARTGVAHSELGSLKLDRRLVEFRCSILSFLWKHRVTAAFLDAALNAVAFELLALRRTRVDAASNASGVAIALTAASTGKD